MTKIAHKLISKLEKFENNGVDSMDWAEWEAEDINEKIIEKFTVKDWIFIRENYTTKSDNMKSLIVNHIHLNKIELADIELEILTKITKTEQIDVAYEALNKITFGFVTSGEKHFEELKGIFLTDEKQFLIKKHFTPEFVNRAIEIADKCGWFQKRTIYKFLNIIESKI